MAVDPALSRTRRAGGPRLPPRALVLASDDYLVALVRGGSEEVWEVLSDVAALPEDQRDALVLASTSALNYGEIAGIIGCPPTRVNALVFQARRSLLATRKARDMPCAEIREQLATLTGAALRRPTLRRHLRVC